VEQICSISVVTGSILAFMRSLLALAALAFAAVAQPAAACSPVPGYRTPTNYELVRDTEAIVLAQVVAGEMVERDPEASTITIRPLVAVKGPLPEGDIALRGMLLSRDAGPELGVLSNPYEFERAHPVSYMGACIRYIFPLGGTGLFFLRTDHEGMWAPAGGAFSRWAEDVPGEDAPWVELVRLYAAAAALPEAERLALLTVERDRQRALREDPLAQLIALDIDRALGVPGAELDDDLFVDSAQTESTLAAVVERMSKAAIAEGD